MSYAQNAIALRRMDGFWSRARFSATSENLACCWLSQRYRCAKVLSRAVARQLIDRWAANSDWRLEAAHLPNPGRKPPMVSVSLRQKPVPATEQNASASVLRPVSGTP